MSLIVKASPGKGLGVFAAEDIPVYNLGGRVIVSMDVYDVSRSSSWDALRRDMGIPDDSGVHCYGGKVIYDPTVTLERLDTGRQVSIWYRMNHCNQPNTKMRLAKDGSKRGSKSEFIEWVAHRSIKKGDEITYHYGEPDPDFM